MGGERFEIAEPQSFMFGDSSDLDFLTLKPAHFPYKQYSSTDPTRALHALVNIRRDSLKFTKIRHETTQEPCNSYRIEFVFDCDSVCSVQILFFAKEMLTSDRLTHISCKPELCSQKFFFEIGANQLFNDYIFEVDRFNIDKMGYKPDMELFPVVIQCETMDCCENEVPQCQATLAVVEKSAESTGFVLKPVKQKLFIDGVCYLLQELYGIENKHCAFDVDDTRHPADVDESDCIVCMSEIRDTVILPCRHLCLCNGCAETLRYKVVATGQFNQLHASANVAP